jgi:hypothetical protein
MADDKDETPPMTPSSEAPTTPSPAPPRRGQGDRPALGDITAAYNGTTRHPNIPEPRPVTPEPIAVADPVTPRNRLPLYIDRDTGPGGVRLEFGLYAEDDGELDNDDDNAVSNIPGYHPNVSSRQQDNFVNQRTRNQVLRHPALYRDVSYDSHIREYQDYGSEFSPRDESPYADEPYVARSPPSKLPDSPPIDYPATPCKIKVKPMEKAKKPPKLTKCINGVWELGKTLGKGAGGVVRLARHLDTGELAAVKLIPKKKSFRLGDSLIPEQFLTRIAKEVTVLKLLDHPNVVKLIDFYEDDFEL